VLEEISKQFELKKQKHYSSTSRTIGWWVCLFIINIIVAILLNSQLIYSFLAALYLPWVPTVLCGLLAAVSMFSVIENFSTGYMAMSLQANVEEIQTLLKYNKSLARRDN
jgi:membrane-anchored protein YejM (alkaline phosphatase superfamily)